MYGRAVVERADVEHARHVLALDLAGGARLAREARDDLGGSRATSGRRNLSATRWSSWRCVRGDARRPCRPRRGRARRGISRRGIWPGCAPAIIGRGSGSRLAGSASAGSVPRRAGAPSAVHGPFRRRSSERTSKRPRSGAATAKRAAEEGEHEERRRQRAREVSGRNVAEQRRGADREGAEQQRAPRLDLLEAEPANLRSELQSERDRLDPGGEDRAEDDAEHVEPLHQDERRRRCWRRRGTRVARRRPACRRWRTTVVISTRARGVAEQREAVGREERHDPLGGGRVELAALEEHADELAPRSRNASVVGTVSDGDPRERRAEALARSARCGARVCLGRVARPSSGSAAAASPVPSRPSAAGRSICA